MRIIAYNNKGTIIAAPKGSRTRPTADKVRGAIFNMLGDISGITVLDLFAGSGALGLEALSRGAAEALLVDNRAEALATIHGNITKLKIENARAVRRDYLAILKQAAKKGERYDLIFVDPPYRMHRVIEPELSRWLPRVIVAGGGSSSRAIPARRLPCHWSLQATKVHGDTRVRIFVAADGANDETVEDEAV